MLPGDVNSDEHVDLKDAVLALQVMDGMSPSIPDGRDGDVNNDDKIGLEEAVYILQKTAKQR